MDVHLAAAADAAAAYTGDVAQASVLSPSHIPVWTIIVMTCSMSAMAGLGALPFFFVGKLKDTWAGLANAVACGVMLTASFDLLHEGAPHSPFLTTLGMVLGALFIKSSQEYLEQFKEVSFDQLSGADARKAMLIVGVMAAHALGEGSGVGVSFSGPRGWAQGTLVTIAIGLHNIPEGMAVATVMVAKGAPPRSALFWSLFCALPQALVAVPSFVFVETFQSLLPLALGFAAGCMVWIVSAELLPDALQAAPHPLVATATTLSAACLQGISMGIATLEQADGNFALPLKAPLGALLRAALLMAPMLLIVPSIAAAAASRCLPNLSLAMGVSTGVLAIQGVAQVLSVPLQQAMAGRRLHLLGWCMAGVGLVALAWRNLFKATSKASKEPPITETWQQQHFKPHPAREAPLEMVMIGNGGMHTNGNSTHEYTAAFSSTQPYSDVMEHDSGAHKWQDGQRDTILPHGPHGLHAPHAVESRASSRNHSEGPVPAVLHAHHSLDEPTSKRHRATDLYSGGNTSLQKRGASLGLMLLTLHAAVKIVVGADLHSEAHVLLPLTLHGLILGLASVGLGHALFGRGARRAILVAVGCGGTALTMALMCLALVDTGPKSMSAYQGALGSVSRILLGQDRSQAGARDTASPVDSHPHPENGWIDVVQMMVAGGQVAGSILYMWPAAKAIRSFQARLGVCAGAGIVVVCALLEWGLARG